MFDQIIDDLNEARRYAVSQPDEAKRLTQRAKDWLTAIMVSSKTSEFIAHEIHRIISNLTVGMGFVITCPDVLRSYCLAAAFELADWAAREEKSK